MDNGVLIEKHKHVTAVIKVEKTQGCDNSYEIYKFIGKI